MSHIFGKKEGKKPASAGTTGGATALVDQELDAVAGGITRGLYQPQRKIIIVGG